MPSSLAAALAASKKNADPTAAPQPHQDTKQQNSNSKSQRQNQNIKTENANSSAKKQSQAHHDIGRGGNKQQSPKNRKGRNRNKTAATEEIVFICDIPSSDEDETCGLNALQISDHKSGGKGRGRGGRGHSSNQRGVGSGVGADNRSKNNVAPNPNNNNTREQYAKAKNDKGSINPGAMPTPWSKKAQEMKVESGVHNSNDRRTNSRWDNTTHHVDPIKNDVHNQTSRTSKTSTNNNISIEPIPMPKLESAKIMGRWADEDSSEDES